MKTIFLLFALCCAGNLVGQDRLPLQIVGGRCGDKITFHGSSKLISEIFPLECLQITSATTSSIPECGSKESEKNPHAACMNYGPKPS